MTHTVCDRVIDEMMQEIEIKEPTELKSILFLKESLNYNGNITELCFQFNKEKYDFKRIDHIDWKTFARSCFIGPKKISAKKQIFYKHGDKISTDEKKAEHDKNKSKKIMVEIEFQENRHYNYLCKEYENLKTKIQNILKELVINEMENDDECLKKLGKQDELQNNTIEFQQYLLDCKRNLLGKLIIHEQYKDASEHYNSIYVNVKGTPGKSIKNQVPYTSTRCIFYECCDI